MLDQALLKYHDQLVDLCRYFRVRRLEVFGSACRTDFNIESSDFDFLVEFEDMEPGAYANAYFGLMEALADLYQRPVDLVVRSAVKNPYFIQSIDQDRTLLYAA